MTVHAVDDRCLRVLVNDRCDRRTVSENISLIILLDSMQAVVIDNNPPTPHLRLGQKRVRCLYAAIQDQHTHVQPAGGSKVLSRDRGFTPHRQLPGVIRHELLLYSVLPGPQQQTALRSLI